MTVRLGPTPWRDEFRATTALAVPLVVSNLANALVNATDVALLGWYGAHELAASALGLNVAWLFAVFCLGVVTASAPLLAAERGRRLHSVRDMRRTVRQTIWVALSVIVPSWAILWNTDDILKGLGQEPTLAASAGQFVRVYMWALLPWQIATVLRNFMAALERPGWALALSIVNVFVNALLGWLLIFGHWGFPALGLLGSATGSIIANWSLVFALAAVIMLHPAFRRYRLFGRFWRADWARYREVWRVGLPIGLQMGFEVGVFSAAIMLMGLFGPDSVAAHAIALQVAALAFMIPLGLGQAATVRVGLAFGRDDPAGIARAGWSAFALGMAMMMLTAGTMWALPRTLIGLFLNPGTNAHVVELAVGFLGIAAIFQLADGAQVVGAGMLRGLQDTRTPMLVAAFGYWIAAPAIGLPMAFGLGLEGLGVWIGLAAGLAVVAVLLIARWLRRDKFIRPRPLTATA